MSTRLIVSGEGTGKDLEGYLARGIQRTKIEALGVAAAYMSVYGAEFLQRVSTSEGVPEVRLISNIGDAVTHPRALRNGLDNGWNVRVVRSEPGIFHPKVIVGGGSFTADDILMNTNLAIVGSANLTRSGLKSNIECSIIMTSENPINVAANAFKSLWGLGQTLSNELLDDYEAEFAKRNRNRSARDIRALGVDDANNGALDGNLELRERTAPRAHRRTIRTEAAAAAWAGLESFTGEYRFQVEFPRDAGLVLNRLIGLAAGGNREIDVLCEDGNVRTMRYRYYLDNAMFRLNIPNDTPGVAWARENKTGIALVSSYDEPNALLRLQILRPGREVNEVIGRSAALGTWGKTPTRLYGWF